MLNHIVFLVNFFEFWRLRIGWSSSAANQNPPKIKIMIWRYFFSIRHNFKILTRVLIFVDWVQGLTNTRFILSYLKLLMNMYQTNFIKNIYGGLQFIGLSLAYRFRHLKKPKANPGAFLWLPYTHSSLQFESSVVNWPNA